MTPEKLFELVKKIKLSKNPGKLLYVEPEGEPWESNGGDYQVFKAVYEDGTTFSMPVEKIEWPIGITRWPVAPLYDEPVVQAMHLAAKYFGSDDGTFNGCNFSHAMREVSGCQCTLDGKVVSAILTGRKDVEVLSGGSHYRIRKPEQATPEVTPEVTGEVEYRDADHRDVGLEVQASSDKKSWDVVPLLAVLPEGKKYRFITDYKDDLFGGYKYARVPADPMRDAPKDRTIEGYVGNRWICVRWNFAEKCWLRETFEQADPVRWREVQQ